MAKFSEVSLGELFKNRRDKGRSGLPILSVTMGSGLVHRGTLDRKTESGLKAEDHLLVRTNDIAYNMMRMWQGAAGLAREDGNVSPAYVVLAPNSAVDPEYASYLFKSPRLLYLFRAYSYGLTDDRLRLYYDEFARIRVSLPCIEEQARISAIFRKLDSQITLTERLLSVHRTLVKGLSDILLTGKHRHPGHAHLSWSTVCLGDLFSERDERDREDLPLLSITGDRGVIPRGEIDRKDASREDKRGYKRIARGDIGYNTMRMWQGVSALSRMEGIVSPAYTVCTPNDRVDPEFVSYLFKHPATVNRFFRYSQGLVDDTLALKFPNFARIKVKIPPVPEQKWIGEKLSLVDQQHEVLGKYLERLRLQKRALMQLLLSQDKSVVGPSGFRRAVSDGRDGKKPEGIFCNDGSRN
jgi:type I restriction enzyme, S subunit